MKKLKDYDKATKEKLDGEIEVGAKLVGLDDWDDSIKVPFSKKVYGICSNCKHLRAVRTRYDRSFARCYIHEFRLDATDSITECTSHKKRGEMSLYDMTNIAVILEPFKKGIGFEK